jgi:DNA-binding XRE family transcriptional regulator
LQSLRATARDVALRSYALRSLAGEGVSHVTRRDSVPFRDGALLRELRRAAGLSQDALASHAGTTRTAVAHWESGYRLSTTRGRACDIAHALHVPLHVLFVLPITTTQEIADVRTRRSVTCAE